MPPTNNLQDKASLLCKAIEAHDEVTFTSILSLIEDLDLNPNIIIPGLPMPLLHLAVGFSDNSPEIVRIILRKGADPNLIFKEDKVTPTHLCVMYDYDTVLQVLIQFGGDLKLLDGDRKSCYDLAKDNVEQEMKEKCFLYLYKRSMTFRKSIKPSDSIALVWRDRHTQSLSTLHDNTENATDESLSDGFQTCASDFELEASRSVSIVASELSKGNCNPDPVQTDVNTVWNKFDYLMTEDESDCSRDNKRLSTIEEESAITASL